MNRRGWLRGAVVGTLALGIAPRLLAVPLRDAAARLAELERVHGGRLGVAMLDTGSGRRIAHRGDQRFLMCSTFKLLLAAAVLARVDRGEEKPIDGSCSTNPWCSIGRRSPGNMSGRRA